MKLKKWFNLAHYYNYFKDPNIYLFLILIIKNSSINKLIILIILILY